MPTAPSIALAQINPTVGDLDGNAAKVLEWTERAREAGAAMVLFPELCLPGYPAEDLYLRRDFVEANVAALEQLAARVSGIAAIVGFAQPVHPGRGPGIAANAAAVISDGRVAQVYRKRILPNYSVFDERRQFVPGEGPLTAGIAGAAVGLTICEDCWPPDSPSPDLLAPGADLIANLSASPYHRGKSAEREAVFAGVARATGRPVAMANTVGGQDELVFDGASALLAPDGAVVRRAAQFEEELLVCDLADLSPSGVEDRLPPLEEVYAALTTGLRDYVEKNRFSRVGLGLSGGIDSALVAALAVDALGPERVSCVVMPSHFSASETQQDARDMARGLGVELLEYEIAGPYEAYAALLGEDATGLASENLQARIRGNLLMALSNRRGWLVLTTGNKSETSVGYSTLYGDMAGGFGPIKDVPKTLVYELARHRNEISEVIPPSVISRAPSAELRADQKDEDSLPPYEVLDRILHAYVEADLGPDEIVATGEDPATVREVVALVDRAEYKRRQAPPGIKITPKSFGRDRRLPVTNRFGR